MGTYENLLDCSSTDPQTGEVIEGGATGGDGKAMVYLLPNQVLTAEIFAPGAKPSAYLVYNCTNAISCLTSISTAASDTVTLTYTNTTGFAENVFLVVDSGVTGPGGGVQDYFLELEID